MNQKRYDNTDDDSRRAKQPRGLCASCVNAATCALRLAADGPVYHCAEFEGRTPPSPRPSAQPKTYSVEASRSRGDYRGLCRTCSRLTECTYPKPEGGVWHCEEYE